MKKATDFYLSERATDFMDVKSRVLSNFYEERIVSLKNLGSCILLVDDLLPSYLLSISKDVKGIVSRHGGATSHSAIICKALDIPYVVADFPTNYEGDIIIDEDKIILNPTQDLLDRYSFKSKEEIYEKNLKGISVYANVSTNNEIDKITDEFKGVGLYRTEFVLMDIEVALGVEKQERIYEEALAKMNGKPITFRTFDIGDDKVISFLPTTQKGVNNYYKFSKVFDNQIEALLKASIKYPGQVKIMFPMIESIEEYQELKKRIVKKARELNTRVPKIGMMLETQRALINIESFNKVDFISIGTNDLSEELFNLKRDKVILYDDMYNLLAKEIDKIIAFSKRTGVSLSICGEAILKKSFAKQAFESGLKKISISPNLIKNIYKTLEETNI